MNLTEEQEKSIRIIESIGTITLKKGDQIRLLKSKEEFIIDKVWERNIVDMTAVKPHQYLPNYREQFLSIQLINFEIVPKIEKIDCKLSDELNAHLEMFEFHPNEFVKATEKLGVPIELNEMILSKGVVDFREKDLNKEAKRLGYQGELD